MELIHRYLTILQAYFRIDAKAVVTVRVQRRQVLMLEMVVLVVGLMTMVVRLPLVLEQLIKDILEGLEFLVHLDTLVVVVVLENPVQLHLVRWF